MIIIGEKINSSLKAIRPAVDKMDAKVIQDVAKRQDAAGANYIDANCGTFPFREPELLKWLVETIQEVTDLPISFDSPSAEALNTALAINKNGKPLINSINLEKERYDSVLPLVTKYDTSVIALCMDDNGMPDSAEDRLKIAEKLVEGLTKEGVKIEDIFIDPLIKPISTNSMNGVIALDTITRIMKAFPGVHTTCGLSNISFGIPARKLINQTFLVNAIAAGLDSAILDPMDKKIMSMIYSSEAVLGKDEYCLNFLTAFREDRLDVVKKKKKS